MKATEGWNFVQVQEIASKAKYSFIDGDWIEAPYITNEGIRLIQTGNIGIGVFVDKNKKFISETSFQKLKCKEVYAGDILICRLADPVGRSCVVPDLQSRSITSVDVCILRVNSDAYNRDFVAHALNQKDFLDACQKQAAGSTRQRISRTNLGKLKVWVPKSKLEQAKIAEVLSTVDRAIEQIEVLIAKQQRIKTGLMQDLFSRGIDEKGNLRSEKTHEFKDSPLGRIPVEWEVKTLDSLCKAIVDCPHTTPKFTQEGVLVARTFNMKDGLFLGEPSYVSEVEYRERVSRLEPQQGDVIFTREAPVGEAYLIPAHFKVCLGQRTMLLRCDLNECLPEYLLEIIYSEDMRIIFDQKVGGTTNPHLNVEDVKSLFIKQPPIKEQQKIATILGEIRSALKWHNREREKLHSFKTGLMQDLLTGKKRVTALLKETEVNA